MKIKKAVILVAGLGTRNLPATMAIPKSLMPVLNKPSLQYVLEECLESGIKEVLIVVSPGMESQISHFLSHNPPLERRLENSNKLCYLADWMKVVDNLNISYAVQYNQNGSGDAVLCAESWVGDNPFALLFCDDLNFVEKGQRPAIGQLMDIYEKTEKMVIGCQHVSRDMISKYSSAILGEKIANNAYEVKGIIEKPAKDEAPSTVAGLARYILPAKVFDVLKRIPYSQRGELDSTDAMNVLAHEDGGVVCLMQSIRHDIGNKESKALTDVFAALTDPDTRERCIRMIEEARKNGYKFPVTNTYVSFERESEE